MCEERLYKRWPIKVDTFQTKGFTVFLVPKGTGAKETFVQYETIKSISTISIVDREVHMEPRSRSGPQGSVWESLLRKGGARYENQVAKKPLGCVLDSHFQKIVAWCCWKAENQVLGINQCHLRSESKRGWWGCQSIVEKQKKEKDVLIRPGLQAEYGGTVIYRIESK